MISGSPSQLPQVFIGSSSEALPIARMIEAALEGDAEVRLWSDPSVFRVGTMLLPTLIEQAAQVDFAVLVATPDDIVRRRGRQYESPRDNILFEAGLFVGSLGTERTLLFHPEGLRDALPTDLRGLTTASYVADDRDDTGNVASAIARIREAIGRLGRRGFLSVELVVQVPLETRASGLQVAVAGTLDKLGADLPHWEPGLPMAPRRDELWHITIAGPEGIGLEYKYMLGPPWNWSHPETERGGGFRANRSLILKRDESVRRDIVERWD